jgi:hypothetical protein
MFYTTLCTTVHSQSALQKMSLAISEAVSPIFPLGFSTFPQALALQGHGLDLHTKNYTCPVGRLEHPFAPRGRLTAARTLETHSDPQVSPRSRRPVTALLRPRH